jgi:hypothetical protein
MNVKIKIVDIFLLIAKYYNVLEVEKIKFAIKISIVMLACFALIILNNALNNFRQIKLVREILNV